MDSVFGNGTFALIPIRCQNRIERLLQHEFEAFLRLLRGRWAEIRALSAEAARLLAGSGAENQGDGVHATASDRFMRRGNEPEWGTQVHSVV